MNHRNLALVYVGLLIALVLSCMTLLKECSIDRKLKKVFTTPSGTGQSPGKVMGGSITVRSMSSWRSVGGCTGCLTTNIDTSQLVFDDTDAAQPSQSFGPNQPWQLEVDARNAAGDAIPTHRGFLICTNYKGNGGCLLNGSRNSSITVVPLPYNQGETDLNNPAVPDLGTGRRYHDSKCQNPCTTDFCEHLGRMYLNNDTSGIRCNNGECRVFIGQ